MRVLFISSFLLFADSRSGAAKRLYYFAQTLARGCELSLICLDAGSEAGAFRPELSPCERFLQVRYERGWADKFRDPFQVPAYLSPEMRDEIERFATGVQFDVVFCAFAFALSLVQLPALRLAQKIVYLEDDLSFAVFQERAKTARQWKRKIHMTARWLQAELFYRRLLPRVSAFVAISEEEAVVIKKKFPHLTVSIVGYGIPMEEYRRLDPPADRLILGFIGNYIHQSNVDAMHFYLENWHPPLVQQHANAVMKVAGKNLPAPLAEGRSQDSSIQFHDNVPDLREFYAGIAIFVNPIVSQRGLRTKLVEAAAFGRPIISTTLGAEGLDDLEVRIADSQEAFLRAVGELQDPAAYGAVADRNRAVVERIYSIEAVGRILLNCLRETAGLNA